MTEEKVTTTTETDKRTTVEPERMPIPSDPKPETKRVETERTTVETNS